MYLRKIHELHVETSNSCNLNCSYCYFVSKKKEKLKFEIVQFQKIVNCVLQKTDSSINLVFHGGEPLLNSAQWIDEACRVALQISLENDKKIYFHIQTNGTSLTDDHIKVLKKYNFTVNVSLDGPKEIHDKARGRYDETLRSIRRLQAEDMLLGVITVIGKHNCNNISDVVAHFRELGIKRYHFNIGSILNDSKELVMSEDEIYKSLVDAFEQMSLYYRESCNWVLLGKLRRFVNKEIPEFACDSPICGAGLFKTHVLPNGDFYPCGSCVNTEHGRKEFLLGNLFEDIDSDVITKKLVDFHSIYFGETDKCSKCCASIICDFLCPAFDRYDKETISNKCSAYQRFVEYLNKQDFDQIKDIVSYYDGE